MRKAHEEEGPDGLGQPAVEVRPVLCPLSATAPRAGTGRSASFRLFLHWVSGRRSMADLAADAGVSRWALARRVSWCWDLEPALPPVRARHRSLTCDGDRGCLAQVGASWPGTRVQRCLVHVIRDPRRGPPPGWPCSTIGTWSTATASRRGPWPRGTPTTPRPWPAGSGGAPTSGRAVPTCAWTNSTDRDPCSPSPTPT